MRVEFRAATLQHAYDLAPRLRSADKAEIKARSGKSPVLGLISSVHASNPGITAVVDDEIICIFGAAATESPLLGSVWLLGSDAIEQHNRLFLRESRRWINALHAIYPVLYNYVDERNAVHLRWLRWLGFSFFPPRPFGVEQRPFYEVVRIDNRV